MKIGKPELIHADGEFEYRVSVDSFLGVEALWYRLDQRYADLVSSQSDAALVALLIPAMLRGEDIRVDGSVSESLFYHLAGPYQHILRTIFPYLQPVRIFPETVECRTEQTSGVATGFSAGIDSYCVLVDHYYRDVSPGFRVTHLLFNNVGSHGSGEEAAKLFQMRYARVRPAAERIGLPLVRVDSNVNAFYDDFSFQQTHTPRNASVALLLQGGIRRFLYASGQCYVDACVRPYAFIACSDGITLPMLSTESLCALSTGGEYTRVQKTLKVAELAESHQTLDVCVQGEYEGNCSSCWKCMRTLLTLDIAGSLNRYAAVFDLHVYRRGLAQFWAEIQGDEDALLREIVSFAAERGFPREPPT